MTNCIALCCRIAVHNRVVAGLRFLSLWVVSGAAFVSGSLLAQTQAGNSSFILTTAAQVHELPGELASRARVHLIGTITYYDPSDLLMFLQDATGGVYVNTDKPYAVHAGDLVSLDGLADASFHTEVAMDPVIHVLGRGEDYPAPRASYQQLATAQSDCKMVEIVGRVRAADVEQHQNAPSMHLDLVMPGGEAQVYVGSFKGFRPDSLLDADVDIKGVAGGAFDAKYQITGVILYVQELSQITIVRTPTIKPQQLPLTDIDDVFRSLGTEDTSQRVHVRGTLTYYKKATAAVLERNGKSLYVQTRQTGDMLVGDVVDAYGFANNREYAPSLRQATLVRTGAREEIVPQPVSYAQAFSGMYSDNLISMSGVLVSELQDVGSDTLVIDVDGHLVSGYLEQREPWVPFPLGSRIRITGICRIVAGGPWRLPALFHLDMRSSSDAELLAPPSWWTIRHLVALLFLLLTVSTAVAILAILLRKRVVEQTMQIKRSITVARERSKLLERISSNQTPDILLSEICDSVMSLLPGSVCWYTFDPTGESVAINAHPQVASKDEHIFEVQLTGALEQPVGKIVVMSSNHGVTEDRQEVYATICELAPLAVRQSLLYESLVYHSTHDPLTELPNRRFCEKMLSKALEEAELKAGRLAVIYIDVNQFKSINDNFGHRVGDLYLQQISSRLLAAKRFSDTLARFGGDEFLIVAPLATRYDDADALLIRLRACFDEPFYIEGERIDGSASFGLAQYPEQGITAEELKRSADHSMYLSKRKIAISAGSTTDIAIITPPELELALSQSDFRLAYQPQFSSEGRLTGVEALVRLEDNILGTLTPDAFLSYAERHDVIIEIGKWILKRALQDAVRWHFDTGEKALMVVNVSERQMEQPGFSDSVLDCLNETGFPPQRLEIELTERTFVSPCYEVTQQLTQLRTAGIRVSIDGFGTGQSCLNLLHKLPIDTIKLDKSFILAMEDEHEVLPIIKAISFMARCLGKRIVAEGIEHVGPIPALLRMGKMDFQGYLLSRPIPAEEVDRFIETWRSGIAMPEVFGGSSAGRRERSP